MAANQRTTATREPVTEPLHRRHSAGGQTVNDELDALDVIDSSDDMDFGDGGKSKDYSDPGSGG